MVAPYSLYVHSLRAWYRVLIARRPDTFWNGVPGYFEDLYDPPLSNAPGASREWDVGRGAGAGVWWLATRGQRLFAARTLAHLAVALAESKMDFIDVSVKAKAGSACMRVATNTAITANMTRSV